MTDTPITREEVERLAPLLAQVAGLRVLTCEQSEAVTKAEDMLIALFDELDRMTDRLAEFEAAWIAFEGATVSADHFAAVDRMRAALRTDKGDG